MVVDCGDVVAYETGILLLQISSVLFFASVAGGISLSAKSKRENSLPRNSIPDLPETAEVIEMQEAATVPSVPSVDVPKTSSFWPDEPRYHRASFQPQAVMTQRRPRALQEIGSEEKETHAAPPTQPRQPRPVTISFDMSQDMEFNL